MEDVLDTASPETVKSGKLLRILGVGFGLAIAVGGTIGVGILRSPGPVAEQLGSIPMILLVWTLGGAYAMLGANYLAELATMMPKAGGFMVYAHRAYGGYGGFVVGWSDWLYNTLGLSFIVVVFGEYSVALFNATFQGSRIVFSISILILLTLLNWIGLRSGSCDAETDKHDKDDRLARIRRGMFCIGRWQSGRNNRLAGRFRGNRRFARRIHSGPSACARRYDGWHSPIYFAEEDTNPNQNLPRSIFGGIAIVTIIYLLIIVAVLYVLPMQDLVGSKFAGADAISVLFGQLGGQIVTILALLSLVGIINALLMMNPRILLALGREGLFATALDTREQKRDSGFCADNNGRFSGRFFIDRNVRGPPRYLAVFRRNHHDIADRCIVRSSPPRTRSAPAVSSMGLPYRSGANADLGRPFIRRIYFEQSVSERIRACGVGDKLSRL